MWLGRYSERAHDLGPYADEQMHIVLRIALSSISYGLREGSWYDAQIVIL
jgi:hypothetical protein